MAQQVKIDKEFLIKHRFWISLPFACLFVFIGFFLVLSVFNQAKANWQTAKGVNDNLKKLPSTDLRNDKWIKRMSEEADLAQEQKRKIWKQEFDRQNGVIRDGDKRVVTRPLITWPEAVQDKPVGPFRRPLREHDFGEPIGTNGNYSQLPIEYPEAYNTKGQYDEIIDLLNVLDEQRNTGAVRVRGEGSNRANAMALLSPHPLGIKPVLTEEAWTLQEDIAIKRELVRAITDANNLVAQLQLEWKKVAPLPEPVNPPPAEGVAAATAPASAPAAEATKPDDKKGPATVIDRQRFLNTTWQLGLIERKTVKDDKGQDRQLAPSTNWWEGWLLDLELASTAGDLFLGGQVANLGPDPLKPTPAGKVAVVLSDGAPVNPRTTQVVVALESLPASRPETTGALFAQQNAGQLDAGLLGTPGLSKKPFRVDLKNLGMIPRKIVEVRRHDEAPGLVDHQRFVNAHWVLDVQMVAGAAATNRVLRGTLFNRTAQRESPPAFEVTLFDGEKTKAQEVVMPGGEIDALNSKGAAADPTKDRRAFVVPDVRHGVPLLKVLSVRQVLDWRSVPVKRVDRLVLGEEARKQNDRIKIIPLKPYNFARKSTLPADQTAAPATAPEGPMMPGLGGGQDAGRLSPNHKIDLNRYYETETEVRRVPVALSLIVDEQHIATVLTAFANSRLRVQVTQEVWTRLAHGIGKPTLAGHAPAGAGGGTGAAGAGGAGGGVNVPAMNKAVDDDTLQVELQIFGLATIYEDPDAPERIEKEKAGGGAAAAGTGPAGK